MAGGKRVPEGKGEPSYKCTASHLEMKIRTICKYEGGQSLFLFVPEFGFMVSTVDSIMKDDAGMKEHVKGAEMMKLMMITEKREDIIISVMEELLHYWYIFGMRISCDCSSETLCARVQAK
jgi:hypothetical protein